MGRRRRMVAPPLAVQDVGGYSSVVESLDQFRISLTRTEIGGWDLWTLIPVALAFLALIGVIGYFIYTHFFAPDGAPDRRPVERGQSLFLQSLRLIRRDPETLAFSGVAAALSMIPPLLTVQLFRSERGLARLGGIAFWFGAAGWNSVDDIQKIRGLMAIFSTYLFCYVCGGLLSLGVLACALKRLRGGEPRLSDGIQAMADNAAALGEYALIGAVARTGMTMLAPARWLTRFALETIWTASQLYVLPAMLCEKLGAVDAIRRSNEIASDSPVQDAWLLLGDQFAFNIPYGAGAGTFFAMLILSITGCIVPESSLTPLLLAELTVLPACLAAASTGMITATIYLGALGGAYLLAIGSPERCYEFFPIFKRGPEPAYES
jgi:uncharacterized protein DUF6159